MKKIIITLSAIGLIFTACKKETKVITTNVIESKKNFLIKAPWKILKIEEQPNLTSPLTEITGQWDACELDDIQTFTEDNIYNYGAGASVCDTFDNQIEIGTWEFLN